MQEQCDRIRQTRRDRFAYPDPYWPGKMRVEYRLREDGT